MNPLHGFEINDETFERCPSDFAGECTIPDGIKRIGGWSFYHCAGLTGVHIPEGVLEIGLRAFSDCRNLKSVVIPDSVTKIEGFAFYACGAIKSVHIPESVDFIGTEAFARCSSLAFACIPPACTFDNGTFPPTCEIVGPQEYRRRLAINLTADCALDGVEIVGMHVLAAGHPIGAATESRIAR